jgi:hypothetical protein
LEIIYEIPNRFRITLHRDVQLFPDAPHVTARRSTPFVINYRAPNAERAEHVELTDELFRLLVSVTPENREMFATVIRYLPEQFRMSHEMGAHLVNAPKHLLEYCSPVEAQPLGHADYWRDAWDAEEEKPQQNVEVLVCVFVAANQPYTQDFAFLRAGHWYDRSGHLLEGVDFWKPKSVTPAVKAPDY